MRDKVRSILIERDRMLPEEADALIREFREEALGYIESGDFLGIDDLVEDYFGLEPDYLDDLIFDLF